MKFIRSVNEYWVNDIYFNDSSGNQIRKSSNPVHYMSRTDITDILTEMTDNFEYEPDVIVQNQKKTILNSLQKNVIYIKYRFTIPPDRMNYFKKCLSLVEWRFHQILGTNTNTTFSKVRIDRNLYLLSFEFEDCKIEGPYKSYVNIQESFSEHQIDKKLVTKVTYDKYEKLVALSEVDEVTSVDVDFIKNILSNFSVSIKLEKRYYSDSIKSVIDVDIKSIGYILFYKFCDEWWLVESYKKGIPGLSNPDRKPSVINTWLIDSKDGLIEWGEEVLPTIFN